MRIKEWPEQERPRERLFQEGARSLSDSDLLALLIGSGTGGVTAVDLAKRILINREGIGGLARSSVEELLRFRGVGRAAAARIIAALELGKRAACRQGEERLRIKTPVEVVEAYGPGLRDLQQEEFHVLLLDNGNRVIQNRLVTRGTLNASLVHPREVFKTAIDSLASGVILLHNHPSGNRDPSKEDRLVTRQMVAAGEVMGIQVMDHIIIAGGDYFSFAESGELGNS